MISADEYRAVTDRTAAGKIVDLQRELVVFDIDTLGDDGLDHHARRQARHRQMGSLLRARFIPVDRAGYVVSGRISFGDHFAFRAAHDEAVHVELLERRIEVELQCAEIRNTLCVLHLDLLHLRLGQGLPAAKCVTGDPIQEPGAVAVDGLIERGAVDE
jgi:hypothetical protein